MLSFGCAVPNFTLSANAQSVFKSVMSLTFVQADLSTSLHVGIERPFEDEQSPFNRMRRP